LLFGQKDLHLGAFVSVDMW